MGAAPSRRPAGPVDRRALEGGALDNTADGQAPDVYAARNVWFDARSLDDSPYPYPAPARSCWAAAGLPDGAHRAARSGQDAKASGGLCRDEPSSNTGRFTRRSASGPVPIASRGEPSSNTGRFTMHRSASPQPSCLSYAVRFWRNGSDARPQPKRRTDSMVHDGQDEPRVPPPVSRACYARPHSARRQAYEDASEAVRQRRPTLSNTKRSPRAIGFVEVTPAQRKTALS